MKQYAWIMAACLTAAMVSGCGVAQKGEAEMDQKVQLRVQKDQRLLCQRVRKQRTKKVPRQ